LAAALLIGVIEIALARGAVAGTNPATPAHRTIFVANSYDVTAYPASSRGNVAPIALTTDMTTPAGIARDASGRIYVTNTATYTVTVYAANANGNVSPIAVIAGPDTELYAPTAIALDSSGKIYVLNAGDNITVYPPLAASVGSLDEAPVASIGGSQTLLYNPTGIALDLSGNIYVANGGGGDYNFGADYAPGTVTVYPAGSNGDVAPIATINGSATGLIDPIGVALDSNGNIYVGNGGLSFYTGSGEFTYKPSITVYPARSNGNAAPMATITGDNTGLDDPRALALDSSENLYVTTPGEGGPINVYAPGSNGNASPSASITGPDTGLDDPSGIALDSVSNLYVLNSSGGPTYGVSVTVYPANSTGDTVPIETISSSFTGIAYDYGIAVDSTGKIYVANYTGGAAANGSVTIYPAGTYASGPPVATIAGNNTGLEYPVGIAVNSKGKISVLNNNNTITEYPAGSDGDVTPRATINIKTFDYSFASALAAGPLGELYVLIQQERCGRFDCVETGQNTIFVYRAGSHGNAKPAAVIAGPDTNLGHASAIAVDHRGYIYVTNQGIPPCRPGCYCSPRGPGSITVYAPDGDVKPITTISGAHSRLGLPYGIALDWSGDIYVLNTPGGSGYDFCIINAPASTATKDLGISAAATADVAKISSPVLIFAAGSNGDAADRRYRRSLDGVVWTGGNRGWSVAARSTARA
jgi:hypothetical protein